MVALFTFWHRFLEALTLSLFVLIYIGLGYSSMYLPTSYHAHMPTPTLF